MSISALPRPCLMGIVNVTPDSFSDTGRHYSPAAAAAHARKLAAEGARILDLGAEASSFFRKGIAPVAAEEQLRRLLPVLERLRDLPAGVAISVDTRSAAVARAAIAAGAAIINDISAGTHEPDLPHVVADSGASLVLMHMSPGYPATPAEDDRDIVGSVRKALLAAAERAMHAGVPEERIALDPGVGFGKTMADNWRLALAGSVDYAVGFPVVLGISRKRFLETAPPAGVRVPAEWMAAGGTWPASDADHPRDAATAMVTAVAAARGVQIHRVHNVALAAGAIAICR